MITPTFTKETELLKDYKYIAGIDEVGRGPLAGPVVAAVVILDPEKIGKYRSRYKWWAPIRDSKILSSRKRGSIVQFIKDNALDYAWGMASHQEIDELNIHHAGLLAMRRAVLNLSLGPDMVLIDGRFKIYPFDFAQGTIAQRAIVDGDAKVLSIAAASILAKVYRDDLMKNFAEKFPRYGFEKHKGYDTHFHRKRLFAHGPCEIHRMSFSTVKEVIAVRFSDYLSKINLVI